MKHLTQAEYDRLHDAAAQSPASMRTGEDVHAVAHDLAIAARRLGFVVTIEQQPLEPLAMGNHADVVSVREARQ